MTGRCGKQSRVEQEKSSHLWGFVMDWDERIINGKGARSIVIVMCIVDVWRDGRDMRDGLEVLVCYTIMIGKSDWRLG